MTEMALSNSPLEESQPIPPHSSPESLSQSRKLLKGVGYALLLVLIFYFSQLISMPLYFISAIFEKSAPNLKTFGLFVGQFISAGFFIYVIKHRTRKTNPLPVGPVSWTLAGKTLGFFISLFMLEIALLFAADRVWGLPPAPEIPGHGFPLFLVLVIGAPLSEELLFRGFGIQWLKENISPRIAIVFTAFGFALAHFSLVKLPGTFALGLLLGWLALRTRSLRLPMLFHAINNSIAFIAITQGMDIENAVPWPWFLALGGLGLATIWPLWRRMKMQMDEEFPAKDSSTELTPETQIS